jgi:hypothetical protein
MVIGLYCAILILPSTIAGFFLVRRLGPALTFVGILAVFSLTAMGIWSSLAPLFNPAQGLVAMIAEVVVASTISGVRLPIVSRLVTAASRPPHS